MNKTKREGAAHGKTGWDLGRIGKLTLVVLILVSSLFGMVGFTAVPTTDDGSTTAENPVVTTAPAAEPSAEPTPAPDVTTTPEPTVVPTAEPTAEPTPTVEPIATPEPTAEQTPTPDVEPTLETETEIPVTLHIIAAPDAEEECIPFTVPAGSSLDLLVNDSVLYSLTGSADMYSAEGETEPEQTETEQTETWEWYTLDTEGGKVPYDLSAPITAPLDVYAARGVAATAATAKTVMFYIAIDGEWVKLTTTATTTDTTSFPGGTTQRYYISYSDLVNVYKDYDSGIEDNTYSGELFFPHRDDNSPQKIWADVAPMKATDGTDDYWIPLGETGVNVQTYYVYYTPGNVTINHSYFAGSKEFENAELLADNSFYTIKFNGGGKVDSGLPTMQYVLSGKRFICDLPALTDAEWVVLDKDGNALDKSSYTLNMLDNGRFLLEITNVTQPLTVTARGEELYIVYNAGIKRVRAGQFDTTAQIIRNDGAVNGMQHYKVPSSVPKDGTMTVLATDSDRAEVKVNNNKPRTIFYTFKGWKLDDSDKLITPGAVFSYDQLRKYAVNNTVTFTAEWTPFEKNAGNYDLVATVNFYVCYDCEIAGKFDKGYTPPIGTTDFTNSVFATRVFGTSSATSNSSTDFNVISPPDGNTGNTPADVDGRIRTLKITGAEGLSLMEFPTDETVLKALRDGNEEVHVNKVKIDHKYLTSDHFTIRWYVFKYEHSDGYHIDGVLVAKEARLVVTKTFTGSVGVIEAVKKGSFNIDVLPADDTTGAEKYKLVLKAAGSMSLEEGETGYTSYDPKTDTYTWVLSGYPNMKYTVKESGDDIPNQLASDYSHTARYMVRNPNQQTVTPVSGWNSYDGTGVTVTVASYAKDILDSAVQTVALENMYVKTGTITVAKRDSVTGHGIAGVEFELSMNDPPEGTTFQLYHKPGSSQYSSDLQDEGYTDVAADNVAVTGGNGYFYLKLKGGHSYTLTERIPLGYNGAASVTFTVDADGTITNLSETCYKDDQGNEIKLPTGSWAKADGAVLSIDNLSHVLTEVKVECNWGGSAADQKEVTVQLWRSGAPMVGEEYTVTLKADSAEEWAYEWHDLPLFVDGKLAKYTVRVTYIGDVAYDANIPGIDDGYEDYDITFDENRYKKGADGAYDHISGYWKDSNGEDVFADHVLIRFNIETVSGKLTLRKVSDTVNGKPLAGVEFTLYSDVNLVNVVEVAVSGGNGEVEFASKLAAGTYYLKETKALDGYALDGTVYMVRVHAGIATVTAVGGDGTAVHTVVNETSQTLTIEKVNQSGTYVSGAKFTLTRTGDYDGGEGGRNDSPVYTSDEHGKIVIPGLERGTYVLAETAAPNGYKQLDTEFKFVVADGKIFVPGNVRVPDGWELTDTQEGGYTLTVTNQVLYVFPTTGGVGIYAPIALGAVLMCTSAVLIIKRKRETA